MATAQSKAAITDLFDLLGFGPPQATRVESLAADLDSGARSLASIRDDLIWYLANSQGISFRQAVMGVVGNMFDRAGVNVATANETADQRIARLADSLIAGTQTYHQLDTTIQSYASPTNNPPAGGDPNWWEKYRNPQDPTYGNNPNNPPTGGGSGGGGGGGGSGGGGTTDPVDPLPVETVDWKARAKALYPWMPEELVAVFAKAWAESGDPQLALAETRQNAAYDKYFPGIKRSDGSLRMTEGEWFATREAYGSLFREFGLNPQIFDSKMTTLMEGNVSPQELSNRLGAAYEQIVTSIPEVRQKFAEFNGIQLSDSAIFAAAIDPDINSAILNRKISVAQIAGEGLARGFDVSASFAGSLASEGLSDAQAQQFFGSAAQQVPILDTLTLRYRDRNPAFTLQDYAQASIFGDAGQARRINRLLAAEQSTFTDTTGSFAMSPDLAVTGLRAR